MWLFAALFAVWWLWSAGSKSLYFPALSSILHTLWTQWVTGPARANLTSSLEHLLAGYVIAGLAGIGLGIALWSLRYVREATSPYLYFLYVLPAPVLVPAAMTLFGIGYYIVNAQEAFDYLGMWSGIIVLAIIGTVANLLFVAIENRVLHWHYGARAVEGTR